MNYSFYWWLSLLLIIHCPSQKSLADAIAKVTLLAYFPCCNTLLISSIGLTDDEMINGSRSNILEHNSPKRLSLLQFASEGTGDKSSTTISFVFRFTFKETRKLTSDTKKLKRDCTINGNYYRGLDTSNQRIAGGPNNLPPRVILENRAPWVKALLHCAIFGATYLAVAGVVRQVARNIVQCNSALNNIQIISRFCCFGKQNRETDKPSMKENEFNAN